MKFCIVTNRRMAYTNMALIFQIYFATPIIRLLIRTPLIVSCLVSGAYLFCDLVHCLVGSTRRTSFFIVLLVSHQSTCTIYTLIPLTFVPFLIFAHLTLN